MTPFSWVEHSDLDGRDKIVDVPVMLKNKVLEIFDRCHRECKLIIWKDFENALMYEPSWLMRHRAQSTIAWARKETLHKEFRNGK